MKTAKDWIWENGMPEDVPTLKRLIAAIQLDAKRSAYAECAEKVNGEHFKFRSNSDEYDRGYQNGFTQAVSNCQKAILSARDKLKLP